MQRNSGSDSQPPAQPLQEHKQRQQPPPSHTQCVAVQYPAAAMVMQHQTMRPQHFVAPPPPPPHYPPFHTLHNQFQHHQGNAQQQQGSSDGGVKKTIWVGDLHHWMDENYLHNCFASTGEFRADYGNQWGGAYYGGAAYDGYRYALQSPNSPGIYAAAYQLYPFYGSYQQQVN